MLVFSQMLLDRGSCWWLSPTYFRFFLSENQCMIFYLTPRILKCCFYIWSFPVTLATVLFELFSSFVLLACSDPATFPDRRGGGKRPVHAACMGGPGLGCAQGLGPGAGGMSICTQRVSAAEWWESLGHFLFFFLYSFFWKSFFLLKFIPCIS